MRRISQSPQIGHHRTDVRIKDVRFYRVFRYLIAYRFDDHVVDVIRVVHGRHDFRRIKWRE